MQQYSEGLACWSQCNCMETSIIGEGMHTSYLAFSSPDAAFHISPSFLDISPMLKFGCSATKWHERVLGQYNIIAILHGPMSNH